MRILLLILLAMLPFSASAETLIAVFVHKGDMGDPVFVLPLPKEGETISATTNEPNTPCTSTHKVQRWVPITCPPLMDMKATRTGEMVVVALNFVTPKIHLEARTSAVKGMALDFTNLEPTKTMQVRVETVIQPDNPAQSE